jgi:phage gp29-like protein
MSTKRNKPFKKSSASVAVTKAANTAKAPEQTNEPLVINNFVLQNTDRTPKDVGNWRDAHKAAESIYYPNRSRYYDLLKDVELDGHLSGIWSRRVSAAVNKKYVFVDADKKPVDDINLLVKSLEFRDMMKSIMTSISHGIVGFEFVPGEKFCWKEIDRKHIKPEKKVLTINQTDYDGIQYEDIDNIWVVGKERDLGLFLKAAFYVLLKKGNFTDWATYIEIFGQPIMKFLYDTFDEKTKLQITKLMENAASSTRIMLPKQADFDVLDGKTSNGNGDLQDKFKDACNDELSILILTVTETTKASSSSGYAQSNTQSDQQFEVTTDDIQFLTGLLNSDKFLSILASYGYAVEGGSFVMEEPKKAADQLVRVQVLQGLKNIGLPLDDDEMYEEFGISKPADYDAQKTIQQQAQQPDDFNEEDAPGNKPAKKDKPPKSPEKAKLNGKEKLMIKFLNFFAPAHKD